METKKIIKAVILAAGEGNRLKPITSNRPKPMIPLAGKPLLEHTLIGLKNAGIEEVLLIVGYKQEIIRAHFRDFLEKEGMKITYTVQEEYLGTAHATGHAKKFVKNDCFLLMYGDLLVDPLIFKEVIQKFMENEVKGLISLMEVKNPQAFGIISLDSKGKVTKITEKPGPELNLGNLANAGVYIFDPLIFEAVEKTEKSIRGEYEFTDSMEILMKDFAGDILGYIIKDKFWSDIGLPWQLLDANEFMLKTIKNENLGIVEKNVEITGNVHVGDHTVIKAGSVIQGPCFIGNDSLIGPNAFIRPFTSIGDKCHVGISEVKNSIIFSRTNIPHFNYIGDSIICENVNLGAGTKVANLRFDDQSIKVNVKGKLVDSQRRKFGTVIGPNVKTGINASIMTGKIIGENCRIGAHTLVIEDVEPNTLYYQDPNRGIIKEKTITQ